MSPLNSVYPCVVADPPWPYETSVKGTSAIQRKQKFIDAGHKGVEDMGYGVMSMEELCALRPPVAKNAHLYLWTTNSFMVEAHDLAKAWGFKPKTICTWVKTHQGDSERVSMKSGYYFRGATEHFLFCVRGSLPLQTPDGLPTAYLWPRIGKHSQKPEAFYDLVEQASPGPYLELFARRNRMGWDTWGNESLVHVEVDAI